MKPPKTLSEKTKALWSDIQANAHRKLNGADYAIIEHFCNEIDTYDLATAKIREKGFKNKHGQLDAAVTTANKAAGNIRQLYKEIDKFLEKEQKIPQPKNVRPVKNF